MMLLTCVYVSLIYCGDELYWIVKRSVDVEVANW